VKHLRTLLIAGSVLILPFSYIESALDPVLVPRFLLLSAILFLIAVFIVIRSVRERDGFDFSFLSRAIFPAMAGYAVMSGISLTQSHVFSEGLFDLLKIVLALSTFVAFMVVLTDDTDCVRTIAKTATVTGGCLSIIAIFQYFQIGFGWIPGNVIPYGTMANKNLLSSALFMMSPFVLYNWHRSGRTWRWISISSVTLILYALAISQTRAVWAAAAVSILLTAGIAALARRRQGKQGADRPLALRNIAPVAAVVMFAALMSLLTFSLYQVIDTPVENRTLINTTDASLKQRTALWDKSLKMAADNPLLGVGIGSWKIDIPSYGTEGLPSETGTVFFQRPHNDFLWVLTETGPIGLILYLIIFAMTIYYGYRTIRETSSQNDAALALLMLFGIIGFLVISFFSYPKERIVHSLFAMLTVSVMVSMYHRAHPTSRVRPGRNAALIGVIMLLCTGYCLIVGGYRLSSEMHTKRALSARLVGDWKTVVSEIDMAASPLSKLDPTSTPLAWYRGEANYSMSDIDAAFDDFEEAYRVNPYHIHVLNNLAACYEIKGDHLSAMELYGKALDISPYFEATLVNLSAVHYNMGNYREALSTLQHIRGQPTDPRYEEYLKRIQDKLK
jgi:O-antigen ligase